MSIDQVGMTCEYIRDGLKVINGLTLLKIGTFEMTKNTLNYHNLINVRFSDLIGINAYRFSDVFKHQI